MYKIFIKFLTEKQTLGDDINWIEHNYDPFLNP